MCALGAFDDAYITKAGKLLTVASPLLLKIAA
jgi:hypothetical protein